MLVLVALLLLAGPSHAQDVGMRRERALAGISAVVRGDRAASAQVRIDLETVLAAQPGDALARVYYGWLLVLQAWSVPMIEAKALALEGCAQMDAAVRAAPEDPAVRIVRARSDYQVPRMLGREPGAEQDFAWLVAGARAKRAPWADALRREVLFHAGAFALKQRRPQDAIGLLEEAAGIPSALPSDVDVQSMLALARRELSSLGHAESTPPDQAQAAAP